MYSTVTMTAFHGADQTIDCTAIAQRLLGWYRRHCRNLPWRRTRDPYAIWVAEIMLQQTRVDTVIAYYERFLSKFPTLASLAAAPLEDVLKAWEGLGYYARARNLHAAARSIVEQFDGRLPRDLEALGLAMLPPGQASDFNQAFMDLGALVCTPSSPRCLICPLMNLCKAQQEGIQDALPIRATRTFRPHRDVTAGVIWDQQGHFLITRRPLDGLLGGLWEFPGGKRRPGESLVACLSREISEELAIEIEIGELLCKIEHAFTHFHMTLYAFQCRWLRGEPQCLGCDDLRWVTLDQLDTFAFPVADQKVIASLRDSIPAGSH
jgi:A/G-specific adenine glycosylase